MHLRDCASDAQSKKCPAMAALGRSPAPVSGRNVALLQGARFAGRGGRGVGGAAVDARHMPGERGAARAASDRA